MKILENTIMLVDVTLNYTVCATKNRTMKKNGKKKPATTTKI